MQCALCRIAIDPRSGYHNEGTQFYHPRCATVIAQMRGKLAAAVGRARRAEAEAFTSRSDAATTRMRNMELDTEATRLRLQLKEAEQNVRTLRENLTKEHDRNRRDREERELAVRRHAELLTENDRLRAELNVRTLGGNAPGASDPTKVADDGRDPSVIRAELLELD